MMETALSQIFLYLASIYIINGILIHVFRRLKLADFIAHVLTGILFSLLLWNSGELLGLQMLSPLAPEWEFQAELIPTDSTQIAISDTTQNSTSIEHQTSPVLLEHLVLFLAHIGLLLFLMQLGFNFNPAIFRSGLASSAYPRIFLSLVLMISILGGIGYFVLGNTLLKPTILIIIAFAGINVGPILGKLFPLSVKHKQSVTALLQLAVTLDIFAIFSSAIFTLINTYSNTPFMDIIAQTAFYWLIISFFIIPIFFPKIITSAFRFFQRWVEDFTILLKLGVICLFLYVGFKIGLSILLLGFWAGIIYKAVMGEAEYQTNQNFFSTTSFLYVLPFVEIGRNIDLTLFMNPTFALNLGLIAGGLLLVTLLISFIFHLSYGQWYIFVLGTFPRGEITLLILWVFLPTNFLSANAFALAVSVVILISFLIGIISQFLRFKPDNTAFEKH